MATQTNASAASHTDPFNRKYKILSKIGEGSYSEVLKCKNRDTGSTYACKRLKHCYRSWNQVNDIPEIVTLRKLARHPNILQMVEIHFDPSAGRVSLVFELMDMNLYELIKDRKRLLPESRVRVMMFQLMRALRHLHKHGIFHRDVKPENILLKNDLLKLGDLGSVRGLYSRPPYTEYISTRWYRSPECLLTCGYYSFKMDVWAAGCVFYEILTLRPLFPGSSELDQINRVHNVLGPPPQKILVKFSKHAEIERDYSRHTSKQARLDTIKRVLGEMKNANYDWYFTGKDPKGVETLLPTHVTPEAKDLLKHLLQYDPDSRPSSHRALQHAYFKELREQAQRAAREKIPSITGPIVTIVGDEGGLEVTADDNANPVDLATLGDAKLKLKAPVMRRTSEVKEVKDNPTGLKNVRKPSSPKIPLEIPKPSLKEAGEMFSRDPEEHAEKKLHNGPPTFESRRGGVDDRGKINARNLASLRFGGDATSASLPYQKIYLEDEEGDGPNTLSSAQLQERRKLSSNLNRRRGGSRLEVERKKSMTLVNTTNESSSGRGFSLDFIDKTSLTPDVMVRINENRRIAHMQPILSSELKKPRDEDKSSTFKDTIYTTVPDIKRHRSPLHSPNTFSPRDFQQRQRHSPRLPKLDTTSPYYSTTKELSHSISDDRAELFSEARISKFEQNNSTEKHVKELLASLPTKKKYPIKNKITEKPKVNVESESVYKPGKNVSGSKNQLVKNINALKNKYETEKKRTYYNMPEVSESKKRDVHQRNTKIQENLLPKGSFTNFSPRVIKPEPINNPAGRHLERTRHHRNDPDDNEHSPADTGRPEMIRKIPNEQRDNHKDIQNRDNDQSYSQRHIEQRKDNFRPTERSNAELSHITQRYERGIVHRHDLNRISEKPYMREKHGDHRDPRRNDRERQDTKYVERRERDRPRRSREMHVYEEQQKNTSDRNSRNNPMGHSPGQKSRGYLDNYDSAGSLSPTNIRRLIENRRKTELATTDTDADGDNNCNKGRQPDSGRRKRRPKYSNFSPSNSGRGPDQNIIGRNFGYSPRNLLPAKYNQMEQPQPLANRLSASGVTAAFKYSNTSSVANKQVREILAEMRKRRDILEDKVTKDTNLQSWNPRPEDISKAKPTSQTIKKPVDIPKREEISDRYLGFPYGASNNNNKNSSKSPYHNNAVKVVKPSGQMVSSLSDFNTGRTREKIKNNNQDSHANTKLGPSSGSMKYLDSEARLRGIGVNKTIEVVNNSYQNTSGANSKAFPRNRYGATVHKK